MAFLYGLLAPMLTAAVDDALGLRKKVLFIWLFHTNRGQPYIKDDGSAAGFSSIWQRFMAKVMKDTRITERFTEHDLRAKVASDTDGEHALRLLGHSNIQIAERVYRRKPETIKPAR